MSEDEYLTLGQPQVLLERTKRWGLTCYSCRRNVNPENCIYCGNASRCPAPTDRKLRQIACAFCRFYRDELGADVSAEAIDAAERYADGDASAFVGLAARTGG